MGLSADTQMDVITPLRRQVDVTAAGRLRLPGDIVHTVAFRRSHHGTPFCLTNVSLPPEAGLALASAAELTAEGATSEVTIIGLLDDRLDAPIAEAEQSITVALADGAAAGALGCPAGHPLLRIDRLYLDTNGTRSSSRSATSCPNCTPTELISAVASPDALSHISFSCR